MRVFLIDFENVHSEGMTGVDHLTDADEVVIFYSNNADSVSFDILHKLMFCKSKLSYYKIKRGGKNALDFQLSCYLGYRICKDPEAEFFIISKDNGYDFVLDFWECGYTRTEPNIRRFSNIKTLLQWEAAQRKQKDAALKAVEKLAAEPVGHDALGVPSNALGVPSNAPGVPSNAPGVPSNAPEAAPDEPAEFSMTDEEAAIAAEIMATSKTSHQFYTTMVKRFRQKRGREIYHHFKNDFKKKEKVLK
jgi:hypothetical protein